HRAPVGSTGWASCRGLHGQAWATVCACGALGQAVRLSRCRQLPYNRRHVPLPSPAPNSMKTPKRLQPLLEDGLIDEVIRPLMSGKEASVYVVRCGDELRCAKVYKEANKRGFRQAVQYQEGRKTRNSRDARAMARGSKYGRKEQEEAWQNAEVAALFRLANAGVRVPKPYDYLDGVLLMELVDDGYGDAAPRLNDVDLLPEDAREFHACKIGRASGR